MSQYMNGFSINIAEMVRITFSENLPDNVNVEVQRSLPVTVCMNYEFLKNIVPIMVGAIEHHETLLKEQVQKNKGLN